MMSAFSNNNVIFTSKTKTAFLEYVYEKPSNRRVSQADKELMIEWIKNPSKRPTSQQEFSRRNYVQKAFMLDEEAQYLLAVAKTNDDKCRPVVTEDMIAGWWSLHMNGTAWDATWRDDGEALVDRVSTDQHDVD
ncbi:MAG: hypothetical protein Q9214_000015 [Letrouitia sp. 1 TL-2023]